MSCQFPLCYLVPHLACWKDSQCSSISLFYLFFSCRSYPGFEDGDSEEGRAAVHEDVHGLPQILHLPNEVGRDSLSLKLGLLPNPGTCMLLFQLFWAHFGIDMVEHG